MPTTAPALVIALVAFIPGILGEGVYRLRLGAAGQEPEWRSVLRLLAFSMAGLILYILARAVILWSCAWLALSCNLAEALFPSPPYWDTVLQMGPSTAQSADPVPFALAYFFHFICSGLVGWTAVPLAHWLAARVNRSAQPTAWDAFVTLEASRSGVGRYVVVELRNRHRYFGWLVRADLSYTSDEPNVVLAVPKIFDYRCKEFVEMKLDTIYLRGRDVAHIEVVCD